MKIFRACLITELSGELCNMQLDKGQVEKG
jgi:hypothetical protein